MHSPYVLVATRSADHGVVCREAVVSLGFNVQVAHDVNAAAAIIARDGDPLLVITDDVVPAVDGARTRELRLPSAMAGARTSGDRGGASSRAACADDPASMRSAIQEALDAAALDSAAGGGAPRAAGPEDALHRAVSETARRFQLPLCVAYAAVDGREHFASHGRSDGRTEWIGAPLAASVIRGMARSGEPLILPDLAAAADAVEFAQARFAGFRGIAGMPIASGHPTRAGLLCVLDTEPLTLHAADLDTLADLARAIGLHLDGHANPWAAIGRTRGADEYETLERLAVTDPLTGLANRRGGDRNIAAEISRAKRQRTPISCILLDVDRFKTVNDTYGHQAGDFLLREFGSLLRRTLRAYDILVRWGGEEFLIVLPGVSLEVARALAERVRRAVERLPIQGVGSVSVSAGVASIGEGYDFDAMLAQADRQLYHAKASGRNRVA